MVSDALVFVIYDYFEFIVRFVTVYGNASILLKITFIKFFSYDTILGT